jgi:hypothetical protein
MLLSGTAEEINWLIARLDLGRRFNLLTSSLEGIQFGWKYSGAQGSHGFVTTFVSLPMRMN